MQTAEEEIRALTDRAEELIKSAPAFIKTQPLFKEAEILISDFVDFIKHQRDENSELEYQIRAYEYAEGANNGE